MIVERPDKEIVKQLNKNLYERFDMWLKGLEAIADTPEFKKKVWDHISLFTAELDEFENAVRENDIQGIELSMSTVLSKRTQIFTDRDTRITGGFYFKKKFKPEVKIVQQVLEMKD